MLKGIFAITMNVLFQLVSKYKFIVLILVLVVLVVISLSGEINSIKNGNLVFGSIKRDLLSDELFDSAEITLSDGSKTEVKLISAKIVAGEITGEVLLQNTQGDASVSNDFPSSFFVLEDGSITTSKLADSAVETNKISDLSITTIKIKDGGVVTEKLADGAVTALKILDGTITNSKLTDAIILENNLLMFH